MIAVSYVMQHSNWVREYHMLISGCNKMLIKAMVIVRSYALIMAGKMLKCLVNQLV